MRVLIANGLGLRLPVLDFDRCASGTWSASKAINNPTDGLRLGLGLGVGVRDRG